MTMDSDIRKPRAFAPDDPALRPAEPATGPTGPRESAGSAGSRRVRQTVRTSVRPTVADLSRGIRWGGILLSSLVGLLALSTTLWFTRYVEVVVERNDWVGWVSFALLC
ncbi:MAG: YcjF family protein, partial [Hyphomicrobium sp.]